MSLNEHSQKVALSCPSCTIFLKFSANRKRFGRKSRYQNLCQNKSSLSNFEKLKFDGLVRNHTLNTQRERVYAWGLMVVLQGYLADAQGLMVVLQGYLAHKKHPPPQDHHRSLGTGLL